MSDLIVLDASAALHLVLVTDQAGPLLERLEAATEVHAPSLLASELANSLWKYARHGDIGAIEAHEALERGLALVDHLTPDSELCNEALSEAVARQHPVYDLLYVVLARRLGGRLLSLDRRLSRLAGKMGLKSG